MLPKRVVLAWERGMRERLMFGEHGLECVCRENAASLKIVAIALLRLGLADERARSARGLRFLLLLGRAPGDGCGIAIENALVLLVYE